MKVNLLPRTNIEESLNRLKTKNIDQHEKELKNLINHLNINSFNSFDFEKLDSNKIYSINTIKSVCIDYRLRFLDIKYFKNKLPNEVFQKIKSLEKTHNTNIGDFKIMAPSALFRLEKTDDPLLFVPLGNNYYYLVHKWGNDLHPFRKLIMWPFKNIWNLLFTILLFSFLVTEITPLTLFTKTPNTSSYWMLLFFMFKAIASVVLYFGFALGKNFNPAIWNNKYNKS
jgi:hypothetical protein|tara:strand:+ start:68384 stop:69064 length:681 start_codon:yes stop_codon:yes gene_type:complete